jgi:hypothetical protein
MFDDHLFLAFPVTLDFSIQLNEVPLAIRSLFIQNDEQYLLALEFEGQSFLAKNLGEIVDFQALEAASLHLYSILKRLVPNFPYETHSLLLLALPSNYQNPYVNSTKSH